MATIAVLGTLDTKGEEHGYVAERIRERGHEVLLIDVGTGAPPTFTPDVTREEVARRGGFDLGAVLTRHDRGEAVAAMSAAAPALLGQLYGEGAFDGIISLGGGGGTAIATAGMRALPIGFPKLMVSTLVAGNVAPYVGEKDIVLMPSIVDVAGLNRVSRQILTRAAGAICGMVEAKVPTADDRPIIVASMFGNSTPCVQQARAVLEEAGYEVLIFHATGAGGRAMEALIESGLVAGVLDLTTTEWADELVGGVLSAGPHRLEAAARLGVPAVIGPGCLDMVNFHALATVPAQWSGRRLYEHNPQVTLMRTSAAECAALGVKIAEKINASTGPVSVILPLGGVSLIGAEGQPFHDAEADESLRQTLRQHLRPEIGIIEIQGDLNSSAYAQASAEELLRLIRLPK